MKTKIIKYENLTTAGKELFNLLVKVWENEDFILGVLSYVPDEDDRFKLIEYLKQHPEMDSEDITLYALRKNRGLLKE